MATVQVVAVPAEAHAPIHPWKTEPVAGDATSVTLLPLAKLAEQVVPQLTPAGVLVTVPVPVPYLVTVRGY
jgi:hypothetical protein